MTAQQFAMLCRLLVERFDDEFANLLAHPVQPGATKYLVLCTMTAPTLGAALHRHAQLLRLLVRDFQLRLVRGPEHSSLMLAGPSSGGCPAPLSIAIGLKAIHMLASWMTGRELPLARVDLGFARPPYATDLQNLFPGPLHFDQACSQLALDSGLLDLRIQRDASDRAQFMRNIARYWIFTPPQAWQASIEVREDTLEHGLKQTSVEQAAQALNVSVRTLCRRLEAEHTSYRQVRDELRRDLAIERLTHSHTPQAHIGCELGFEDVSSFHRAFRSWTGVTPNRYRNAARQDSGATNGSAGNGGRVCGGTWWSS